MLFIFQPSPVEYIIFILLSFFLGWLLGRVFFFLGGGGGGGGGATIFLGCAYLVPAFRMSVVVVVVVASLSVLLS